MPSGGNDDTPVIVLYAQHEVAVVGAALLVDDYDGAGCSVAPYSVDDVGGARSVRRSTGDGFSVPG